MDRRQYHKRKLETLQNTSTSIDKKPRRKNRTKAVFSGKVFVEFLMKNIYMVVIIFCFLLLMIENGYEMERKNKEISTLENEIRELRFESIQAAADLMNMRRQSEVIKQVDKADLGLKSSKVPPVKLYK